MKLAKVFQRNAVLQRDQEIPVWGKAEPGSQVICKLGDNQAEATCGEDGRFMVRLPAMPAMSEALTLTVENATTEERIVISPVYMGDVFLTSGQSNMSFRLDQEDHFEQLKANGDLDNFRIHYFHVPFRTLLNPPDDMDDSAHWAISSNETAPKFSAISFLFAHLVAKAFPNLRIGMIEASYGGTGIESWMSYEALDGNPFWHDRLAAYHSPDRVNKGEMEMLYELFPSLPAYDEQKHDWHLPDCDDSQWETMELPDSWTETGRNYAGIFWFRKDIELSEIPAEGVIVSLGGVDKGDETYVNGVLVGKMGDGIDLKTAFVNRAYQVPAKVLKTGRNVIAVRVLSAVSIQADGGLVGPDVDMFVQVGDKRIPLTGTWKLLEEANLGTKGADGFAYCGEGSAHGLHILFDNMIAPIVPYGLRGVIWYQGGCNAINQVNEYYECLKSWYRDWTSRWNQKNLDVILVQSTGIYRKAFYQPYSQRTLLREAQQKFCDEFKVPMVVSTDTGTQYDSHPTDKMPISSRAAAIEVAKLKGERLPLSAEAASARYLPDGGIQVVFDCFGGELDPSSVGSTQCVLLKADGSWEAVPVEVTGTDILSMKTDAKDVVQVIYNWSNYPLGTLRMVDGLPVAPFRIKLEAN